MGMSSGFILALFVLSSLREILGAGTFLGYTVLGSWFKPWTIMVIPGAGAFLMLGILLSVALVIEQKTKARR